MTYEERYTKFLTELNARFERMIFTGHMPTRKLPWPAIRGQSCPYCHGRGHDDGGPGSWWCNECNGTGILGARFGERPIIYP